MNLFFVSNAFSVLWAQNSSLQTFLFFFPIKSNVPRPTTPRLLFKKKTTQPPSSAENSFKAYELCSFPKFSFSHLKKKTAQKLHRFAFLQFFFTPRKHYKKDCKKMHGAYSPPPSGFPPFFAGAVHFSQCTVFTFHVHPLPVGGRAL